MKTGRVMITGAGGFTGRHACRYFKDKGWEVAAVVSPRSDAGMILSAAQVIRCDLTDGEAAARLCRDTKPDAVLHLAGRNAVDFSWRQPALTLSANLMSTVHLLEGARAEGVSRVLIVGSMLQNDPTDLMRSSHPYGFSKTLQVTAARAWRHWYGLPIVIVEPSNLIGPGGSGGLCGRISRWAALMEDEREKAGLEPFFLSSLHEARDFLDVRDAASAYERLLSEGIPGEVYALESGTFRTLGEVKDAFDVASTTELPWWIGQSDAPSPVPRDSAPLRQLGWQPSIPFHNSIRDALGDERNRLRVEREGWR
ncbi:NAD-dependent epimerase/dehydratase family protein [Cohnella sp.]|uniref:NAD-dependent epimerase/dehydratase family protein n=1 Tax=Cohnella sp. TaxID=1883426 RepID=UPI003567216E